jgi:hypothetical protein
VTPRDDYRALVAELAPLVAVWEHLLATHVRDDRGWCTHRLCRRPGCGTGYLVHPCPTRVLALGARARHRGEGMR